MTTVLAGRMSASGTRGGARVLVRDGVVRAAILATGLGPTVEVRRGTRAGADPIIHHAGVAPGWSATGE
jgi:hypothetical protein